MTEVAVAVETSVVGISELAGVGSSRGPSGVGGLPEVLPTTEATTDVPETRTVAGAVVVISNAQTITSRRGEDAYFSLLATRC